MREEAKKEERKLDINEENLVKYNTQAQS